MGEQVPDPAPTNPKSIFRFGLYELDGGTGELRKDGVLRPRLQGQPLDVLLYLLSHADDVVTRDELRLLLWPTDTFVDYDHSLNTAVNKVREALNDSADNPRFIQTIPRRGYRFIASVEVAGDGASGSGGPKQANSLGAQTPATSSTENRNFVLSDAHDLPDAPRGVIQFLFSLIQVMYLFFYVISLARLRWVEPVLSQAVAHPNWILTPLLLTALVGIPLRLYLLSAAIFGYRRLPVKFLRLFPFVIVLDELWALAPFLLVDEIGVGMALAATAALLYLPFRNAV